MNPKISIITVTFNCKEYLERTINSLKDQSFRDFEHIVIDGGSTDGTVDIMKKYLDRIAYWVSEPDNGIYDAMNKGLKAARGDYVIFLNAGDTFYENTTLEKIPFEQHPDAGVFYGETMIINENGKKLGLRRKKLPHNLTWKHFKHGMVVCHQSVLVKRAIAPMYNTGYRLSADIEWVLISLKNSKKNVFTNSIISEFMEGGASIQNHKESLAERFTIMKTYFGLPVTILMHIVFVFSNLIVTVGIAHKYRKSF
ncbi:MAG: glycosyltransferase [Chlorobi bacterium]|nr:glycosyltransferase [Chlorobiota bacterium]